MTKPTPEDKAVALAEKHGLVIMGLSSRPEVVAQLIAVLAERDKQHTEELAQGSGVMPEPDSYRKIGSPLYQETALYTREQFVEAIATLQAKLQRAEEALAYAERIGNEALDKLEQVREQTRREVLALQKDADCFNFWVHEAWNNPSDIMRLLNSCETADDYRAKLLPLMEQRKSIIDAAMKETK